MSIIRKFSSEVSGRTMSNSDARRHVLTNRVSDNLTDKLSRPHKGLLSSPAVTIGNGGQISPPTPRGGGNKPANRCREIPDIITCQECLALPPWQLCPGCTSSYMDGLTE